MSVKKTSTAGTGAASKLKNLLGLMAVSALLAASLNNCKPEKADPCEGVVDEKLEYATLGAVTEADVTSALAALEMCSEHNVIINAHGFENSEEAEMSAVARELHGFHAKSLKVKAGDGVIQPRKITRGAYDTLKTDLGYDVYAEGFSAEKRDTSFVFNDETRPSAADVKNALKVEGIQKANVQANGFNEYTYGQMYDIARQLTDIKSVNAERVVMSGEVSPKSIYKSTKDSIAATGVGVNAGQVLEMRDTSFVFNDATRPSAADVENALKVEGIQKANIQASGFNTYDYTKMPEIARQLTDIKSVDAERVAMSGEVSPATILKSTKDSIAATGVGVNAGQVINFRDTSFVFNDATRPSAADVKNALDVVGIQKANVQASGFNTYNYKQMYDIARQLTDIKSVDAARVAMSGQVSPLNIEQSTKDSIMATGVGVNAGQIMTFRDTVLLFSPFSNITYWTPAQVQALLDSDEIRNITIKSNEDFDYESIMTMANQANKIDKVFGMDAGYGKMRPEGIINPPEIAREDSLKFVRRGYPVIPGYKPGKGSR